MNALRVAFAGTPEFAVPPLRALMASGHQVVGVLTQPDRPKGRGLQLAASPVKQAAEGYGIAVAQPQTLKTEESRSSLREWQPDVLVVVAYGLILPPTVLDLPRLGCVNIHASLLPRWRGAAPIQRAILAGDAETGVTIMRMDAGLDTGPMLLQRRILIAPGTTAGHLHDQLASLGTPALLEALDGLSGGGLVPQAQPAEGVTYAAKIEKSEARIDWSRAALEIERQIRAFNPWPVAEARLDGEQLRIFAAQAETAEPPASAGASPGDIVAVRPDALLVRCGAGSLAIKQVQRAGRKPITARELANSGVGVGRKLG